MAAAITKEWLAEQQALQEAREERVITGTATDEEIEAAADLTNGGWAEPLTKDTRRREQALRAAAIYAADADRLGKRLGITETPSGAIGKLTALDLPYGPAPDPLVSPFLTRDEATIIYAKGGTGKGLIACWLIVELVRMGEIVLVYDAEGHRREWGSRLRAMGLTEEELGRIHYRSPSSDEWTSPAVTLDEAKELVRADCDELGVTVLIVDSYTYAAASGADLGGAKPAKEFFDASKRIGRHTIVLAHNTGAAGRFPDRPFGSVHVKNGSREAWAVEKVEGEQTEHEHDANPLQPGIVALEMRCTKMSERSDNVPPQFITFSFFHDGHIEVIRPTRTRATIADMAAEALGHQTMTTKQIAAAITEDFGEKPAPDTVKHALQRDARFSKASDARPAQWKMRDQ